MQSISETRKLISSDPENWLIYLMDFVDDFRYYKDPEAINMPFEQSGDRLDSILASTCEYLCDELGIKPPLWLREVPGLKYPWFVAGMENLKAIALVESPLRFRIRQIFVLENFLTRV